MTVLANVAPTAKAGGPYTISMGQTLYLNGSASSDPDGLPSPLTYAWNLDADPALGSDTEFDDATGRYGYANWSTLESLGFTMGGTYEIYLQVSDGAAVVTSLPTTVTVRANQAPTASAGGPYTINMGQTLYLNGSASSDPDGLPSPLTYAWDLDDDGEYDDATGCYPLASWSTLESFGYAMGVTKDIHVKVSDGALEDEASTTVTVRANQLPTASAGGPYAISVGQTLYLNGSGSSDPDGLPSPLSYAWDLDGDGDYDDATGRYAFASWSTLEGLGFELGTNTVGVKVSDGAAEDEATADVIVTGSTQPYLSYGTVSDVGSSSWTTVTLPRSYTSMVVVATPNYDETSLPGVTRIRNASGNSFEVRVDCAGAGTVSGVDVHYVVVEQGVYDEPLFKMEAVKYNSTQIDRLGSWNGESRSYLQTYDKPVVVGQVMSYNDPGFSVFWTRGASATAPPSSTDLYMGRQIGEDPNWASRPAVAEKMGYLVIESTGSGTGMIEGLPFVAAVGGDTVRGITDAPPYTYAYPVMDNAKAAVASQAGMDGNNGGWAVLYGGNPLPADGGTLSLAIDEDQLKDTERAHTTEQVAYLVIDPPIATQAAETLVAESRTSFRFNGAEREGSSFQRSSVADEVADVQLARHDPGGDGIRGRRGGSGGSGVGRSGGKAL